MRALRLIEKGARNLSFGGRRWLSAAGANKVDASDATSHAPVCVGMQLLITRQAAPVFHRLVLLDQRHDIADRPKSVAHTRGRRRRYLQRRVDFHEVVPDHVQRHHVAMVLEFLREARPA